jgi:iron complex transport system substrate-binding protein
VSSARSARAARALVLSLTAGLLLVPAPVAGQSPDASSVAPAGEASGEASAGFPLTLEHKYGSTTIEAVPERIVTVGLLEQDPLLALGVTPVGTTEWFGGYPGSIWPWAQPLLGDTVPTSVGDATAVDAERIAALDPDVILALYSGLTQEQYDQLSGIAPTVAQPAEYVDYGIPWQELTRTVGAIVGKAAEADALVSDV